MQPHGHAQATTGCARHMRVFTDARARGRTGARARACVRGHARAHGHAWARKRRHNAGTRAHTDGRFPERLSQAEVVGLWGRRSTVCEPSASVRPARLRRSPWAGLEYTRVLAA